MNNSKPITKKEIKARTAEANIKRNKKRDFRKFANQMFKNPTDHLPLKLSGFGNGESAYCYKCKCISSRVTIKEDKTLICRICQGTDVEMRAKDASIIEKLTWRYREFIYARQHKK